MRTDPMVAHVLRSCSWSRNERTVTCSTILALHIVFATSRPPSAVNPMVKCVFRKRTVSKNWRKRTAVSNACYAISNSIRPKSTLQKVVTRQKKGKCRAGSTRRTSTRSIECKDRELILELEAGHVSPCSRMCQNDGVSYRFTFRLF